MHCGSFSGPLGVIFSHLIDSILLYSIRRFCAIRLSQHLKAAKIDQTICVVMNQFPEHSRFHEAAESCLLVKVTEDSRMM